MCIGTINMTLYMPACVYRYMYMPCGLHVCICAVHVHVYLELILLEELRADERTELARLEPGEGGGGRLAWVGGK